MLTSLYFQTKEWPTANYWIPRLGCPWRDGHLLKKTFVSHVFVKFQNDKILCVTERKYISVLCFLHLCEGDISSWTLKKQNDVSHLSDFRQHLSRYDLLKYLKTSYWQWISELSLFYLSFCSCSSILSIILIAIIHNSDFILFYFCCY